MVVMHELDVELYGESGLLPGAGAFAARYARYQKGPTKTRFVFQQGAVLDEVVRVLADTGLKGEHAFSLSLKPTEVDAWPAFHVSFPCLFDAIVDGHPNPGVVEGLETVNDYASGRLLVSARVRRLLGRLVRDVEWQRLGGSQWFAMGVEQCLPEPELIPGPRDLGKNVNPSGTFAIRHDGRVVINERNRRAVANQGVCWPDRAKAGRRVVRMWPRPLVVSGTVLSALRSARVRGCDRAPLFPLLLETDPLASAPPWPPDFNSARRSRGRR